MSGEAPRILGLAPGAARALLIASLALNFLVVGVVGGAALKMRGEHGPRFNLAGAIAGAAAPERRGAVEAALAAPGQHDWRTASRERWSALAEGIAARPFDPAALEAALAAAEARRSDGRAARNAATAAALALLTDDERASLSGSIRRRLTAMERRD